MRKHYITVDDKLYEDIASYCKLNNLKVNAYCCDLLKREHNITKYGDIPFGVIDEDSITFEKTLPLSEEKNEHNASEKDCEMVHAVTFSKDTSEKSEENNIKPIKRRL